MKNLKQKLIYNAKNIARRKLRLLVQGRPSNLPMTMEIEASRALTDKHTQQHHSKRNTNDHHNERETISKSGIEKMATDKDTSLGKLPSSNQTTVGSTTSTGNTSPGTSTENSTLTILASTSHNSTHGKMNPTDDRTGTVELANFGNDKNNEHGSAVELVANNNNIVNGIIQRGATKNGDKFTIIQDGTEYEDTDKYMNVQITTELREVDLSMLTEENHEGEDDDKKVEHNKYYRVVTKFAAKIHKQKLKIMTSKKGNERLIDGSKTIESRSNNDFKNDFEYSLDRPREREVGATAYRNFRINLIVQINKGFGNLRYSMHEFLQSAKIWMYAMNGPRQIVKRGKVGMIVEEMTKAMYLPERSNEINREAAVEYQKNPDKYVHVNTLGENEELPFIFIEKGATHNGNRKIEVAIITCPYKHVDLIRSLLHETSTQFNWKFMSEDMQRDPSGRRLYNNAQHQQARFINGHVTIQIFNVDAYELEEIREEILNVEGVVSIHRTYKTDQQGRWTILAQKAISDDALEKIDVILKNIPLTGPHKRICKLPPRRVVFSMEKVSSRVKENLVDNFAQPKQRKPAWQKPLSYVQTNKDDVSTATATTKGTDVFALQEQVNELREMISDSNKQGKEKERILKNQQREVERRLDVAEKKIKDQDTTIRSLQGANVRYETQYITTKNDHAELSNRVNAVEATNKEVKIIAEGTKKDVEDINANFSGRVEA